MLAFSVLAAGLVLNPVAPVSRAVAPRAAAPVMAAADGFVPDMQVSICHQTAALRTAAQSMSVASHPDERTPRLAAHTAPAEPPVAFFLRFPCARSAAPS